MCMLREILFIVTKGALRIHLNVQHNQMHAWDADTLKQVPILIHRLLEIFIMHLLDGNVLMSIINPGSREAVL